MALDQAALEAVRVEFQAFLEDLKSVEKKVIYALTEVARDILKTRPQGAGVVASVIIDRVLQAPISLKLPTLYLLDSIVKLVGEPYVSLFAVQLPKAFAGTWQAGNPNLHKSLQKLYSTWSGVFSQQVLIDIAAGIARPSAQPVLAHSVSHLTPLLPQFHQPNVAGVQMQANQQFIAPPAGMLGEQEQQLYSQPKGAFHQSAAFFQQPAAPDAQHQQQQPQQQFHDPSKMSLPLVSVEDLMASLVNSGVLAVPSPSTRVPPPAGDAAIAVLLPQAEELISVEFSPKQIKDKNPAAQQRLLSDTEQTKSRFLDRKFLRRQRKTSALCISRLWYVDLDTWMASTTGGEAVLIDSQEQEAAGVSAVPENCSVSVDDSQTTCALSGERFEQFWDEKQQEWHYRNTKKLSDEEAVRYGLQAGALVLVSALSTTAGNLLQPTAGVLSDFKTQQDISADLAVATGATKAGEVEGGEAAAGKSSKHERQEEAADVLDQPLDQKRLRSH